MKVLIIACIIGCVAALSQDMEAKFDSMASDAMNSQNPPQAADAESSQDAQDPRSLSYGVPASYGYSNLSPSGYAAPVAYNDAYSNPAPLYNDAYANPAPSYGGYAAAPSYAAPVAPSYAAPIAPAYAAQVAPAYNAVQQYRAPSQGYAAPVAYGQQAYAAIPASVGYGVNAANPNLVVSRPQAVNAHDYATAPLGYAHQAVPLAYDDKPQTVPNVVAASQSANAYQRGYQRGHDTKTQASGDLETDGQRVEYGFAELEGYGLKDYGNRKAYQQDQAAPVHV